MKLPNGKANGKDLNWKNPLKKASFKCKLETKLQYK